MTIFGFYDTTQKMDNVSLLLQITNESIDQIKIMPFTQLSQIKRNENKDCYSILTYFPKKSRHKIMQYRKNR